ncbi:hypothetical protein [Sorangium atrum]|uniref:Secreted protein n=1 Tax=Sorangium atrum TaxID=2995308 RepID=A0ABT5C1C2_9BACT|nr:hypothetical protein [Sorangium aterium]MDC0679559.1 hypothetical protein [Sorangium aterium]
MMVSTLSTFAAVVATLLCARSASAAQSCVFYASGSIYYNTSSASEDVYAYGPISFVWEPATDSVLGGYYTEQVVYYDPVETYFNDITSGVILGSMDPTQDPALDISIPSMSFSCTVPVSDDFSLEDGTITGTSSAAILQGYLDGPFLIEATGTVVCN